MLEVITRHLIEKSLDKRHQSTCVPSTKLKEVSNMNSQPKGQNDHHKLFSGDLLPSATSKDESAALYNDLVSTTHVSKEPWGEIPRLYKGYAKTNEDLNSYNNQVYCSVYDGEADMTEKSKDNYNDSYQVNGQMSNKEVPVMITSEDKALKDNRIREMMTKLQSSINSEAQEKEMATELYTRADHSSSKKGLPVTCKKISTLQSTVTSTKDTHVKVSLNMDTVSCSSCQSALFLNVISYL